MTISALDDRAEHPEGVHPAVVQPGHPVLDGVPEDWPALLGYNQLTAKSAAQVLVRGDADPLLTVGRHGAGRSAAFASDCAPHWCPPRLHGLARLRPAVGQPDPLARRPRLRR